MPTKSKKRTFTTHLRHLDVTWRIYNVKVAGFGAFGNAVRFGVEIMDVAEKKAA